ncbi:MAG: oxidoreductase [Sphingobacteriales bacterium]|uniref:WD40/YVTN/BNR-like repeat-containing protein n=1 Tax=Hydrotalea flava TaxID=714549 RepID=UPI000835EC46|nr:YCF48-related protein [Hydrotalea flava]RTL56652.1 MAG: oxidoreductase [Sphingobacteriales bacterium]
MASWKLFFITCMHFTSQILFGQHLKMLTDSSVTTSIRTLSAVGNRIIWAAGSNGQVAKSTDGGQHWHWLTVNDFATSDFRAIQAFDENEAIIMAVGEPALLLKTTDGGLHWNILFKNDAKGMFLDALFFTNKEKGWVIGDPVSTQHPFMATTINRVQSWQTITNDLPVFENGEAFFASSNSNIFIWKKTNAKWMVSGGTASKLYINSQFVYPLPLMQGSASQGANSIDCYQHTCIVVGGDFMHDTTARGNAAIVTLHPSIQIKTPIQAPNGYRSCVKHIQNKTWICCGTSGIDISYDDGLHWQSISNASFHTICITANKQIFLAGNKGRLAKLIL